MHYELNGELGAAGRLWLLRERRGSQRAGRDFYAGADDGGASHPVTAEAERRVRGAGAGRARFRRLLVLSEELGSALPEATRAVWLELEEQLHAHWLAVAAEHYNQGVAAGLQRAAGDAAAARELPPLERVRALAAALRAAIDEL